MTLLFARSFLVFFKTLLNLGDGLAELSEIREFALLVGIFGWLLVLRVLEGSILVVPATLRGVVGDVITPKLSVLAELTEFFLLLGSSVSGRIGVLSLSIFLGVSVGLVCFSVGRSLFIRCSSLCLNCSFNRLKDGEKLVEACR